MVSDGVCGYEKGKENSLWRLGKKTPGRKKSELKDNQISLREVRSKN
jgi:hypothetical protein